MLLRITTLGRKAKQLLKVSETASVWGSTSQGVFLYLPPKEIIFLTFASIRGPITVNLEGDPRHFQELETGQSVSVQGGRLVISRSSLGWDNLEVWEAPEIPDETVQVEKVLGRYKDVLARVSSLRASSFMPLTLQMDELGQGLQPLLGKGNGLTPLGDDVILGCLLTLNRWSHRFLPGLDIQGLSQELVSAAFSQTSLLSANLIACAAEGQADERLVLALDGIFTGQPSAEACADLILSWGDSSGAAALIGMGAAIKLAY